ncbi:hypothetical protein PGB90_001403 [Kerria lacca]
MLFQLHFSIVILWYFYFNPLRNVGILCLVPVKFPSNNTYGGVWPKPVTYKTNSSFLVLRTSHFNFKVERYDCDIIQEAIRRYYFIIFMNVNSRSDYATSDVMDDRNKNFNKHFTGFLDVLQIHLMAPCESLPTEFMDERYELKIDADGFESSGLLIAQSVWGILRGLETFSQVIIPIKGHKYAVQLLSIMDFPRYSHRGLLVDTSRHYIPVTIILRILDAMVYSKMNVFHWHITDDQSFPFQSVSYPLLSQEGAYDRYLAIYTHLEIKRIIEYGRLRGIRVIPEFDSPGHTLSWGKGIPGFLTKCGNPEYGEYGPVDPSRESNYVILENLFKEISELFLDNYLHLGGDEVDFECWGSNQNILNFMKRNNISSFTELESFYIYKLLNITKKLNTKAVVWQEVFDNNVPLNNDTIVHVWKNEQDLDRVTKNGHKAILSSCWYLDHLSSGGDWEKFYSCNPLNFVSSFAQQQRILGGEACMWAEVVDETNIQQRIWPRACATAEILWSGISSSDSVPRLEEHVCRLKKRGVPAQPPNGPGFCPHFIL